MTLKFQKLKNCIHSNSTLRSWPAEQELMDSIPSLTATISENGYLLLLGRNMAEIFPKKAAQNPENNQSNQQKSHIFCYLHMVVLVNYIM